MYELSQISEGKWEIKKGVKAGMNVPVRVYGTKELAERMKRDRTFDQATNVACLPGIVSHSFVMPDGHEGYGFPIGGVAAFNFENGIVSPGGVGYDINCLTGDSRVLTNFGYFRFLSDIANDFSENSVSSGEFVARTLGITSTKLMTLNKRSKKLEEKEVLAFIKSSSKKKIIKIRTKCGFEIKASEEHKIMTKNGMQKASELRIGSEVAVYPFTGVEYTNPSNRIIVGEEKLRSLHLSEAGIKVLKEKGLLPLREDSKALPSIARIFGYVLGDGYVSDKGDFRVYGNLQDMLKLKEDLLAIGFKSFVKIRHRTHKIKTLYGEYEFKSSVAELGLAAASLAKLFIALGMPSKNKTISNFEVPEWVREAPRFIKRLFLAGFFGAEMSSPSTHTKTGFYAPVISQNKNRQYVKSGRKFFTQIMAMLEEFGVKSKKISVSKAYKNRFGDTYRIRLLLSSDEENLLRLWGRIGFEFNNEKQQLANIAVLYILQKKRLREQRIGIAEKVKEYKKIGLTAREIKELLISEVSNERFIERCLWEKLKNQQRITLDFISFNKFVLKRKKELESYGALFDEIEEISEVTKPTEVYDLTLRDNHNFIANNIIVSNCGVRLILTNLSEGDVKPKIRELMDKLFRNVPSGVGSKGKLSLSIKELDDAVRGGAQWAIEKGYGWKEDVERQEENGCVKGADPSKVSQKAKSRGAPQFGTLGAGNHFLEVQRVEKIIDERTAKAFGIQHENQVVVMLHCGSRGFGHQVCDDYIRVMLNASRKYGIKLPDQELCCAPLNSQEANDYFGAMYSAVNYAFCNRQVMTHWIRETFEDVFKRSADSLGMKVVYDVCHNIAKIEEHELNGRKMKLCVHRKGATRAFPAGREEIPPIYRGVGQPVLIPGSMGSASYVLVGVEGGKECFYSTCHGAGRMMSRHEAIRRYKGSEVKQSLESKGVQVRATEMELISEEAPGAYKNIDEVVNSVELAGISKIVAKLAPLGVAKG